MIERNTIVETILNIKRSIVSELTRPINSDILRVMGFGKSEASGPPPVGADSLLIESSSFFLLENGSKLNLG